MVAPASEDPRRTADFAEHQLAEQHGHQLSPAGESLGVALGSVLMDWESKSVRGISFKTWEKMLHTVDKAVSSSDGKVLANPTYQIDAALPLYLTYC